MTYFAVNFSSASRMTSDSVEGVLHHSSAYRDPEEQFTRRQLSSRAWRYRITVDELLEVMRRHDGICPIHLGRMPDMVIDHCHETGIVRDLICRTCNTEVGWIERGRTDIRRPFSKAALAYVDRWRQNLGGVS